MEANELEQIQKHLDFIYDMVSSVHLLPSLRLAANLDIAGLLKDGPRHASELAEATNSHPEALYRLLRFLANEGIFIEMENRVFAQSEISHQLREDVPFSMRDYASGEWLPEWRSKALRNLPYAVQTGTSAFRHAHDGMSLYEYFSQMNPEMRQRFSRRMSSISKISEDAITFAYDFSELQTVVDVGGAGGTLLIAILRANPHLRGVLFDLPYVIEETKEVILSSEVAERFQVVGGDFFEALPSGVDAYIMRFILHNWNDEKCLQILKNCRESSPDASVLIMEHVIPSGKSPRATLALDLWMLIIFDDAKERTEEEYRNLLEASGYRLNRVISTMSPFSILEGIPA